MSWERSGDPVLKKQLNQRFNFLIEHEIKCNSHNTLYLIVAFFCAVSGLLCHLTDVTENSEVFEAQNMVEVVWQNFGTCCFDSIV